MCPAQLQTPMNLPLQIDAPADLALKSIWDLAELETEANLGKTIETKDDWDHVIARYHALVSERRHDAAVPRIIREVAPAAIQASVIRETTMAVPRKTITAFGVLLEEALNRIQSPQEDGGVRLGLLSAFAPAQLMRQILDRLGLT